VTALPETLTDAHAEIERLRRTIAWSEGRRGDGVHRAPGFTPVETRVLRVLASTGFVSRDQVEALQRHMSNIRRKLRELAPAVNIRTIVMEGYELAGGKAELVRLLQRPPGGEAAQPSQMTPTQRVLAERANQKAMAR
jgi:hypothetical protein